MSQLLNQEVLVELGV